MRLAIRLALAGALLSLFACSFFLWTISDSGRGLPQHFHGFPSFSSPWRSHWNDEVMDANAPLDRPDRTIASPGAGAVDSIAAPAPSSPPPDRAVVMAKLSREDTSWVGELADWTPHVYVVNDITAPLHTSVNKGREALAYLSYILDNYPNVANTTAFVHSHKDGFPAAWHTDTPHYSNVESLQMLRTAYVQESGYVNLRCNPEVGCPAEVQMTRQPKDPEKVVENELPRLWKRLFGEDAPEMPDVIAQPCCAQFAVSREQVLRRPRSDYERIRSWLLETPLEDGASGRIMEYLWHIIFGKEAIFCPYLMDCYCKVYGRCDFSGF